MNRTSPVLMVVLGCLMMIGGILVRFFTGSPRYTLLLLNAGDFIPPVWLMCILWTVSFFVIGGAAGCVLGYKGGECEVEKYKGGMLFVLLGVLELCWYPSFFGAGLFFLGALESILILCLSVGVVSCFFRVSKFAGVLFLLHTVWLAYMLILNFAVLFTA